MSKGNVVEGENEGEEGRLESRLDYKRQARETPADTSLGPVLKNRGCHCHLKMQVKCSPNSEVRRKMEKEVLLSE